MDKNSKMAMVGWHGIVATTPDDWALGQISGDRKKGYFRVDNPGTMALEVKWAPGDEKVDLEKHVETYLKELERAARKRKSTFNRNITTRGENSIGFTWKADRKAVGRIWRCGACGRVLIAQVSGLLSENVAGIGAGILQSISDHNEDGWQTWAAYGLVADIPPGYELLKFQLYSGYTQLVFKKKAERLTLERWGLADVALRKSTLREWFDTRACKDLVSFRYKVEDVEFESGAGLLVTGRRWGLKPAFESAGELARLQQPAAEMKGYVWLSEENNRIYSVQSIHSKKEDVIDEVLERVVCH